MSLFELKSKTHAISILKDDHDKVKALFEQFEKTKNKARQMKIADKAIEELKIHATIEEEIFYPALRQKMDDPEGLMEEADEEHHVAKLLIAELDLMTGKEKHWEAKFIVLAENIRHHIKEEEGDMFPDAEKTPIDFETLGKQMMARKKQLQAKGVPPDAEAKMYKKAGLRGDSPAAHAEKKIVVPLKTE